MKKDAFLCFDGSSDKIWFDGYVLWQGVSGHQRFMLAA